MSIETQKNKRHFKKTLCFLFSGKAGVGKTFCSTILKNMAVMDDLTTGKFSFATAVKFVAINMLWNKEKDLKGRTLLQKIGAVGREYDEDVWVKKAFNQIEDDREYPFDVVIFDDWRFPNEFNYIQQHLGLYEPVTIRIEAPSREILTEQSQILDPSETSLDDFKFDYVIHNEDKSIKDLEKILFDILIQESEKNNWR